MSADLVSRVLDLAAAIQQIPAPTFKEKERALFIQHRFHDEGLSQVEMDELANVYACLPGTEKARPLVVSAHADTVFPPDTDLSLLRGSNRFTGPGIGDNALGAAGLFALVWALRQTGKTLPGDLWLVANVREEGLGDLRGMAAVVDRFGDQPLAYLVIEGMALGRIYHRGLGVRRYRISARTQGGHSWVDHGAPSAIHELASLVEELTALPLSEEPRSTHNVGVIVGGTSVNTIASHAQLELDLRSSDPGELAKLAASVEKLAEGAARSGVRFSAEVIGDRPVGELPSDHPLVKLAVAALQSQGERAELKVGSTDANLPLARGLPAVCIGLTRGGKAHTINEFILTQPVSKGLAQLHSLVVSIFDHLA